MRAWSQGVRLRVQCPVLLAPLRVSVIIKDVIYCGISVGEGERQMEEADERGQIGRERDERDERGEGERRER